MQNRASLQALQQKCIAVNVQVDQADHKITVGHRSISDQSSCWHGQIELYTVKNVSGHIDDLLPNIVQYPLTFQLEHATCVGYS